MAVYNMTRVAFDKNGKGGVFHQTITTTGVVVSDIFIMPYFAFSAIAAKIIGDGVLQFTNDPPFVIENDTAEWEDWDGISIINPGLVAFRVNGISGTVTAKITLRTPIV